MAGPITFLKQKPVQLILLPLANLLLAGVFWFGQLTRYQTTVQGVLYGWILLGLLFVFVQLSLFPGAWRDSGERPAADRFGARWLLASQIVFCLGVIVYTCLTLTAMMRQHARLVPYDALIVTAAALVLLPAMFRYRRQFAAPQAKLAYATAFKVAPQYVQAAALATAGAGGMRVSSLGALVSIVGLRFLISRATHQKGANQYTGVTLQAARRDWWSVLVMLGGWAAGKWSGNVLHLF